jgi:hypothetical protein
MARATGGPVVFGGGAKHWVEVSAVIGARASWCRLSSKKDTAVRVLWSLRLTFPNAGALTH